MSDPGDSAEREAERLADLVMTMPKERDPDRGPQVLAKRDEPGYLILRKGLDGGSCDSVPDGDSEPEEREEQDETPVLAKRDGAGSAVAAPLLPGPQQAGGSALPPAERAFLEPRIGHEFRNVRVHVDDAAAGMARSIGAAAFTLGHHIYFGHGRYSPGTAAGRKLLAHELIHVIQQGAAGQSPGTPARVAVGERPSSGFVLQRYTLSGFPPAEEAAMKAAIPVATSKVSSCSDLSWWGRRMTRIAINDRRYDYVPELGLCGWTFPGSWYIEIGKSAFVRATCCDLASTIAHEASHTQLFTEGRARRLECKCFGCGC